MTDAELVKAALAASLTDDQRVQVDGLDAWLNGSAKSMTRASGRVLTDRRRAWLVKLLQALAVPNTPAVHVTQVQCGPLVKLPPGMKENSPRHGSTIAHRMLR